MSDEKPRKSALRWALTFVRYALCVAAIVFLVYTVPWYDMVRIGDADGAAARLIEWRPDELVVQVDGQRQVRPWEDFYQEPVDGEIQPVVEPGLPTVITELDLKYALIAIAMFAPVWFIQSFRLVLMVQIQGVSLNYWKAVMLTFAGCFFNFALPGTTGGDLVKAYYLTRFTHLKTEVFTTVFLDRAIGLFSVVLIATTAIIFRWDPEQFGDMVGGLAIVFGCLIVGVVVVFSRRVRATLRLSELAERLPMGEQVLRIGRATVAMRQHKVRTLSALALSLVLQSIVMISAAVMAKALGMRGDLSYYFIYVSIGFLIAAIPITPPQAIGVMEAAYVEFFTHAGLASASQAVALAIAVRAIQLIWALPGVLVPLFGAHMPTKAELAALESQQAEQAPASAAGPEAAGAPSGSSEA